VGRDGSKSLFLHNLSPVAQFVIRRRQMTPSESFRDAITFDLIAMECALVSGASVAVDMSGNWVCVCMCMLTASYLPR
jgi:hypothetical protein